METEKLAIVGKDVKINSEGHTNNMFRKNRCKDFTVRKLLITFQKHRIFAEHELQKTEINQVKMA